jgi:hypothetical protein
MKKKNFSWGWVKENFWNVVAILIIWQIVITAISLIISLLFDIPMY